MRMRRWRWVFWVLHRPSDAERLAAWLARRYRLTGATTVSTCDALRLSPIRRVQRLDAVLRELAAVGALRVSRRGRERLIEFGPSQVTQLAAVANTRFPDLYRFAVPEPDPAARYMSAIAGARIRPLSRCVDRRVDRSI
jgi:hypothetical protein